MTITPALAAELAMLTQTLDQPGTDIADTLIRLIADVQSAVDSYLGLSIAIATSGSPFDFTVLDQNTRPDDIKTSVLIPLAGASAGQASASDSVAVILYAGVPGAFTDLAADLSWITGRRLAEFSLDEHRDLQVADPGPTPLSTRWTVDQAIGVLIGRGSTFEQAERKLHERAATAGIEVQQAAALVLADLTPLDPQQDVP